MSCCHVTYIPGNRFALSGVSNGHVRRGVRFVRTRPHPSNQVPGISGIKARGQKKIDTTVVSYISQRALALSLLTRHLQHDPAAPHISIQGSTRDHHLELSAAAPAKHTNSRATRTAHNHLCTRIVTDACPPSHRQLAPLPVHLPGLRTGLQARP